MKKTMALKYIFERGCWNSHPLEDSLCSISQCLFFHSCVVCLYSVRFLWLVDITYLDLSKRNVSLYIFFNPMFMSVLHSLNTLTCT